MPYLSFFVRRFGDEILYLTGRRDLNTEYTVFDLRCYENVVDAVMNAGHQGWLDWNEKQQWNTQIR